MAENNQYQTSKVEAKDFTSGWMIAFILAGMGVSLPMLYLGAEIALAVGFRDACIAFLISTLVLAIMCMATTLVGNRSRLSTYMILRFPFGKEGAKIINSMIGISLLGWFSVSLELLAVAIQDTVIELMALQIPMWSIILIASLFMTVTTIYGIKSIERLAHIAVPILFAFLLYVLWLTINQDGALHQIKAYVPNKKDMTLFGATSTLIGASILMPVLMADFSRFIRNDKQSLIAVLGLAIGTPVVFYISTVTAIQTGEMDIIQIMKSFNLVLPAFILLFVSTWVTNATNLYSTVLTFSTINSALSFRNMCIVTSVVGTILALLGFSNYLFEFLNILGVFAPGISGIYLLDFFWVKKQHYALNKIQKWEIKGLISWGVGSLFALLTYFEIFQITHAHFLDSFLISGILYFVLSKKFRIRD